MTDTRNMNGVTVLMKQGGTTFGGETVQDRIRDEQGKLKADAVALTYGGILEVPLGADADTGTSNIIDVSSITLNDYDIALVVGGATVTLTATVLPANATDKTVTWVSSDTSIATVSAAGVVTAVAPGVVTITATADHVSVEASATVTAA